MNHFYLYPNQASGRRSLGPPTKLALQLWLNPATPAAQLRLIAASTEPIDVTVYDATGRVRYQTTTLPNSTLPLEHHHWAIGAYTVRVCQGRRSITRLLMRE